MGADADGADGADAGADNAANDRRRLLPWTKLLLLATAGVQTVAAFLFVFDPGFVLRRLWPAPLEPPSHLWIEYDAALYVALALGALYALVRDDWRETRTYFVVAGAYGALSVAALIATAAAHSGVPAIVWVYLVLSLAYVGQIAVMWRLQERRT
jgi:hypothetical protein